MSPPQDLRPAEPWRPGLVFTDAGAQPVSGQHHLACTRHQRLLAFLDSTEARTEQPGVLLLFSLPADVGVIHGDAWAQVTRAKNAMAYRDGDRPRLEMTDPHGWTIRWRLSPRTLSLIDRNNGLAVSRVARQRAARLYRRIVPEARGTPPWRAMLSDAASWWYQYLLPSDFGYLTRTCRMQPLPRVFLARRATALAAIDTAGEGASEMAARAPEIPAPTKRHDPGDQLVIKALARSFRDVAKDKPGRPVGRARMVMELTLALAKVRGLNAFHLLNALSQILLEGGILGSLLAPRTVLDHLNFGLQPLYRRLDNSLAAERSADAWHREYTAVLADAPQWAKRKLRAFLVLFHRYLLVTGAEPLTTPLPGLSHLEPPHACGVTPEELAAALSYIDARAPTKRVRLQARFIILLGYYRAVRPWEFWCIRIADVQPSDVLTITLYVRMVDGSPKSPFQRRATDIVETDLATAVLDLYAERIAETADVHELLMGDARAPDGRHQPRATEHLVREALKWSTGMDDASQYDLRHTAITNEARRLRQLHRADLSGDDRVFSAKLRAFSGHAGNAVHAYVHPDEDDWVPFIAAHRACAWQEDDGFSRALKRLEVVQHGLVGPRPPIPTGAIQTTIDELSKVPLDVRLSLLEGVIQKHPLESLAVIEDMEVGVVEQLIRETVDAAQRLNWVKGARPHSTSMADCCSQLKRMRYWDLASRDTKWSGLRALLIRCATQERSRLLALVAAWSACVKHRHFSVADGPSAQRLVRCLLDECGLGRSQLALCIVPGLRDLHPAVAQLTLDEREDTRRKGRPHQRLIISPMNTVAMTAPPRVLSMLGLHWLFVVARAWDQGGTDA